MRGLATAGPGFRLRARRLASGVASQDWVPIGVSRMLWREGPRCPPPSTPTDVAALCGGDRPAEPGELAGGGDGDDRAPLAALLHPRPHAIQPALALPRQRDDGRIGAALTSAQRLADARRLAIVPGRLDQQPA